MDNGENSFDALEWRCADNDGFFEDYSETYDFHAHHESRVKEFGVFTTSSDPSNNVSENTPEPYGFRDFLASGFSSLSPTAFHTWAQPSGTGSSNSPSSPSVLHADWNLLTHSRGFASSGPTNGVGTLDPVDVMPLCGINTYPNMPRGFSGSSAPVLRPPMMSDSHLQP